MRYIQASISDEDHREFSKFAFVHEPKLTLSELIERAIHAYMKFYADQKIEESGLCEAETTNP